MIMIDYLEREVLERILNAALARNEYQARIDGAPRHAAASNGERSSTEAHLTGQSSMLVRRWPRPGARLDHRGSTARLGAGGVRKASPASATDRAATGRTTFSIEHTDGSTWKS